MSVIKIKNLHVEVEGKEILKGLDLEINDHEIHALMGPNGNGKSTLLQAIMGNPKYKVTEGQVLFNGEDLLEKPVDERSKAGVFLAMQYPQEVSGVTNSDFLRACLNAKSEEKVSLFKFIKEINKNIEKLEMKEDLAHRYLNEGFSGGEKKRNEILQMRMLKPSFAMLDEIDSGLDVDAINVVGKAINDMYAEDDSLSLLVVSHYERFYSIIKPTHAHVLINGKIVKSGDSDLAIKVDTEGYDWLYEELNISPQMSNTEPKKVQSLGACAHNTGLK